MKLEAHLHHARIFGYLFRNATVILDSRFTYDTCVFERCKLHCDDDATQSLIDCELTDCELLGDGWADWPDNQGAPNDR